MGVSGMQLPAAVIGVATLTALAQATTPTFFNLSPETVIVDLNAGQTRFECTGYARDLNPSHTVSFVAFLAPFMKLDTIPGNPGYFRVHAENLTGAQYGAYFVDVIATDGIPGNGTATSFNIGIVPEPGTAILFVAAIALVSHRRSRSQ